MMKRIILSILLIGILFDYPMTAWSQQKTVSGLIRDINTHTELKSVNVYLKGTDIGTTSDVAGRYKLIIVNSIRNPIIVFKHIAYITTEIPYDSLKTLFHVDLQPRVIPLQGVSIEEEGIGQKDIDKDLPQTISVIEARNYEIRGFVDAGDLLRVDHSVQVDEELSGQKTVAIRGGNSDEVVVLYNGVKMNNAFDNVFDLSLIDLEDIERFELIKGSNTSLYGPEAFSGVINIVPKMQQDYNIRFQQRFGTYRSGNWGLHFFKKYKGVFASYSIKRGGLSREFIDADADNSKLENSSTHHNGTINYTLTDDRGEKIGTMGGLLIYSKLNYQNTRDAEKLNNTNGLFSMKYTGRILGVQNIDLTASFKQLDENQLFNSANVNINRTINDNAYFLNTQKMFKLKDFQWLVSYQYQYNKLDFLDDRRSENIPQIGLKGSNFTRNHHGFVSIIKYHGDTQSDYMQHIDLDISLRHDRVNDKQTNLEFRSGVSSEGSSTGNGEPPGEFDRNHWNETMFKFALNTTGLKNDLLFNAYLNFGSNTKFPTLFQQISSPLVFTSQSTKPDLNPEKNNSFEIGLKVTRDVHGKSNIYGWQISSSYFQNHYTNKFRIFTSPRTPLSFYDNVQNANISGFEGTAGVFLFKKKVTVDLGLSRYFISEKAAFPFKSDHKRTLTVNIDHAGYSFQLFWFTESEQTAWLRLQNGEFTEITNSGFTNLDLHLSKTFELFHLKVFANASARNILNKDRLILEGLATRDRRFYLTVGAQY